MPSERFSISMFADQLHEFIIGRNLRSPDILGCSMGGYVATYLARKQPGAVGRIITLGTKWKWTPEIASREVKMLDLVLNRTSKMMLDMGEHNPLSLSDLAEVKTHILICLGNGDTMVSREESEEVADALPNGSLQIVMNSEHPIEKEIGELVEFVERFVGGGLE